MYKYNGRYLPQDVVIQETYFELLREIFLFNNPAANVRDDYETTIRCKHCKTYFHMADFNGEECPFCSKSAV